MIDSPLETIILLNRKVATQSLQLNYHISSLMVMSCSSESSHYLSIPASINLRVLFFLNTWLFSMLLISI